MHPLRIGLVFTHSLGHCRRILCGIKEYAETKPAWILLPIAPERATHALAAFRPAGVIAHIITPALADHLLEVHRPLVNVSAVVPNLSIPRVGIDDVAVGRLAAAHLLDRGFMRFGFVGQSNHAYSEQRERGFREVIEDAGHAVACYHDRRPHVFTPMGQLWALDRDVLHWVRALPKPVGLFAPNDIWGVQLAEVCRQLDLRVPEDVALLGVDNDDLLCNLSRPALSSIALPAERLGHEAAALLDRLLTRKPRPTEPLLLPPRGVVTRRSSDTLALHDADVAAAVRFIREHRHLPLSVSDVVAEVAVSRRSLERRFRLTLRRGVWAEIRRVHLERACELLASTDMPLFEVAESSGFSGGVQLSVVFRQEIDLTPSAYRRQFRQRGTDF